MFAPSMKQLFSSLNSAEAGLLKNLVEEEGVPCTLRNEQLTTPAASELWTELWVVNDEDYPKAKAVLDDWKHPAPPLAGPWVCPACGETSEGQFASCWKCGKAKEG